MADIWNKHRRSKVMSRIRSKNTRPELIIRSGLHALGLRFRLHKTGLPGKPDLVLPKYHAAVFVHGCFWHLHPGCNEGRIPKTARNYWGPKLQNNKKRDSRNIQRLRRSGWRVMRVWECKIERDPEKVLRQILTWLSC